MDPGFRRECEFSVGGATAQCTGTSVLAGYGSDADELTPQPSCAHDARQDRLPDGGIRRGDHLWRTGARLEPGRAAVPLARPQAAGPYRATGREFAPVHGDLLGGATLRAL